MKGPRLARTSSTTLSEGAEELRMHREAIALPPLDVHLEPSRHVVLNMRTGTIVVVEPVAEGSDDTRTLHRTTLAPFRLAFRPGQTKQAERVDDLLARLKECFT